MGLWNQQGKLCSGDSGKASCSVHLVRGNKDQKGERSVPQGRSDAAGVSHHKMSRDKRDGYVIKTLTVQS